ncbi:MAG: tetratricopeptide repeat protein [Phycisphaerae bacterium]|nr:tetratricopeptide repeat protein [Phycisphaerae bacterium]
MARGSGKPGIKVCAVWVVLLTGCGSPQPAAPPSGSRPTPPPAPLSAKALLRLDQLQPPIPKTLKPTTAPAKGDELPPQASQAVAKAQSLIDRGRYAAAVNLLIHRAVDFAPTSSRVHRILGLAYTRLPNPDKALIHLRKAVQLDGDDLRSHVMLARLYAEQKQHDKAIGHLRTALNCTQARGNNPLTGEAVFRLGGLLTNEGYWAAALECYERLSKHIEAHGRAYATRPALRQVVLRPQRLLMLRGKLLQQLGRSARAAKLLRRAFNRNRSATNLARLLAEALTSAGQITRAQALVVELTAQPNQRAKVPAIAAGVCKAAGDKDLPLRIWQACRAKGRGNGKLAVALAQAAQRLGADDQATKILQAAVAMGIDPGDALVVRFLVDVYIKEGKTPPALRLLAGLLEVDPRQSWIVRSALDKLRATGLKAKTLVHQAAKAKVADRPAMRFLAGQLARLQGDRSLAGRQYEQSIAADHKKSFLPPYEALAELYTSLEQHDKCAVLLKRLNALSADPDSPGLHYVRAKIHLAQGNGATAAASLRKALGMDHTHAPTWAAFGEALALTGQARRAASAYRTATKIDPNYRREELTERLYKVYLDMRNYGDAQAMAESIIRREPVEQGRRGKAMLARALVLGGQADSIKRARRLLAELKAKAGDDPQLRLLTIQADLFDTSAVMFKKDSRQAVDALERLAADRSSGHDKAATQVLAKLLEQNGEYLRAAETWKRLPARRFYPTAQKAQAVALLKAQKYALAAGVLEEILAGTPGNTWARDALIDALKRSGRHHHAAKRLRAWLQEATDAKKAYNLRVELLEVCTDGKLYDQGQKLLDDWLVVGGAQASALMANKVRLFSQAKQHDKAVALARKWLADSPKEYPVKAVLIHALVDAESHDKAHALLDGWLADYDKQGSQEAHRQAATLETLKVYAYTKAKQWAAARTQSQVFLKNRPENSPLRGALVHWFLDEKKHEDALEIVDRWLEELTATSATQPAPAASSRPETQPTSRPAGRGDRQDETITWCRQTAVRILLRQKGYQKALDRVERYLKQDSKNIDLLDLRATCWVELGRLNKATIDLKTVHKLAPKTAGANNNLGYQLACQGTDLNRAERMIRFALDRAQRTGMASQGLAYLDSLGWVLYKRGKLHQAGKVFLEVVRRGRRDEDSRHPVMFNHAGDVHYRLGWTRRAVALWSEALELAKDDKWDSYDTRLVKANAPAKIAAAKAGKPAKVDPLGKGVALKKRDN